MRIRAVLEAHLVGTAYPTMMPGDRLKLPLLMSCTEYAHEWHGDPEEFTHRREAEYEFCGIILAIDSAPERELSLVQACRLRFLVRRRPSMWFQHDRYGPGFPVWGQGTLMLGGAGEEVLADRWAGPDPSHSLQVRRIWEVRIPNRLRVQLPEGTGYPTWLLPWAYTKKDVRVVEGTRGDPDAHFHVLELEVGDPAPVADPAIGRRRAHAWGAGSSRPMRLAVGPPRRAHPPR